MAEGQTAALQLPTATVRNGGERPFLGAVEHRSRADRWLDINDVFRAMKAGEVARTVLTFD